mmetsp:Transcript_34248/g.63517  ORF Transcript_34248/g.63517 Transcript_34248/m.63517 type:complete len:126 (+) Transcript_34248:880-1257(+)
MSGMDQEKIFVNLNSLGPRPPVMVFCMSIWTDGETFESLEDGFCRLVDEKNGEEKCYFPLNTLEYGAKRAVVLCKVHKEEDQWRMTPIGEVLDDIDYKEPREMEEDIREHFLDKEYKNPEAIFRS